MSTTNRTRTSGARNMKRLVQDAREIVDVLDEHVVLRARPRDADRIALLERVVADQMRRHLPRDAHERDGIHQCVRKARHGIGRTRTRRHETNADLAGRARIAFGGMQRPAFLAGQGYGGPSPAGRSRRKSAERRRPDIRRSSRRPGRPAAVNTISAPVIVRAMEQLLRGRRPPAFSKVRGT